MEHRSFAGTNLNFWKPTPLLRQFLILSALATGERLSQRRLAELAGLSPSVVNTYLTRFQDEGLLEKSPVNARDFRYLLTLSGKALLGEMIVEYMRESFRLFSQGKWQLARHLKGLQQRYGLKRVALYSAGEVTELVLHSLPGTGLEVAAIVDDDPEKQGRTMFGYPIIGLPALEELQVDGIIITTFKYRAGIVSRIRHLEGKGIKVLGL